MFSLIRDVLKKAFGSSRNINGFKAELLCYFYFGVPVAKTYISKLNLDRDLDRKKLFF